MLHTQSVVSLPFFSIMDVGKLVDVVNNRCGCFVSRFLQRVENFDFVSG